MYLGKAKCKALKEIRRQIAEKNLEENNITTEKPVSVALDEILENQYKILESEELERK